MSLLRRIDRFRRPLYTWRTRRKIRYPGGLVVAYTATSLRDRDTRAELASQADQERFECQRGRDLQLLRLAPGRPPELARALGCVHPLEGPIGPQLGEPVDVHGCAVGPRRDDDEIAIPRLELLELGEQLLSFRAALGPPHALLGLAPGQLQGLDLHLSGSPRLLPALRNGFEESLRAVRRLEGRVDVHGPRDLDQRLPPLGCRRVDELER